MGCGLFPCTVCDKDARSADKLTTTDVPIFVVDRKTGVHEVKGWTSRMSSCESCSEKLGKPIKVMHRPYERDIAEFEEAKDIILDGSGPRDD